MCKSEHAPNVIFGDDYTVIEAHCSFKKSHALIDRRKVRKHMLLPVAIVGLAMFVMAFVGLNRIIPTLFGLGSVVGIIYSLYLLYLGFTTSNQSQFIGGIMLLLASGAVLVYLKSSW